MLATKVIIKRVEEYFEMLAIATRQKCAQNDLTETFGGIFKTIDVDIGSSLDGLLPGAADDTRNLDLHFLDDLRLPQDQATFLVPDSE